MSDGHVRLRATIADHAATIAVALIVLALIGGYVTYGTHVDPDTTTERERVTSWQSAGSFDHQATVTNGTEAFPEGAVLENRTTYFKGVNPTLDGSFTYGYEASDGGNLTANTTVVLVVRSVDEDETGEGTEYWRVEEPLVSDSVDSLPPDDRVRVPFSVDVPAMERRADEIDSRLGASPGQREVAVEARIDLSGTRNGVTIDRSRTYRLPVTIERGLYRVEDPGPVRDSGGRDRQETVPVSYGPMRSIGGPLLALLSIGGLIGLLAGRHLGITTVSDRERDRLAFRRSREEFDEWITTARIPRTVTSKNRIEVTSLRDLVDLAIDTNERVLEADTGSEYVVLRGDRVYVYEAPIRADSNAFVRNPGPITATETDRDAGLTSDAEQGEENESERRIATDDAPVEPTSFEDERLDTDQRSADEDAASVRCDDRDADVPGGIDTGETSETGGDGTG